MKPLTRDKTVGFAVRLAGRLAVARRSVAEWRHDPAARGARLDRFRSLVATVATGVANFCYKLGLIGGATRGDRRWSAQGSCSASWTRHDVCLERQLRLPTRFAMHSGPAAGVLLATILVPAAWVADGEASIVVPIAQMGFVVAAMFGVAFFN